MNMGWFDCKSVEQWRKISNLVYSALVWPWSTVSLSAKWGVVTVTPTRGPGDSGTRVPGTAPAQGIACVTVSQGLWLSWRPVLSLGVCQVAASPRGPHSAYDILSIPDASTSLAVGLLWFIPGLRPGLFKGRLARSGGRSDLLQLRRLGSPGAQAWCSCFSTVWRPVR